MSRGLFHTTDRSKKRKLDKEERVEKEKQDKAKRENLDKIVQVLCTASEAFDRLGFLLVAPEYVIAPKRGAKHITIPLIEKDERNPNLTLNQLMWRSTTEKYDIKPEAIGKLFIHNEGSTCKFTGLYFGGTLEPSRGRYDVIIDRSAYSPRQRKVLTGTINLFVLSNFLSASELRRVLLIAHFKEGAGLLNRKYLPLDIFKLIWRFAFVKPFNEYRVWDKQKYLDVEGEAWIKLHDQLINLRR